MSIRKRFVQIEKLCTKQFLKFSNCKDNIHTRAHAHKITHAHVICCILRQCSKTEISVKCI